MLFYSQWLAFCETFPEFPFEKSLAEFSVFISRLMSHGNTCDQGSYFLFLCVCVCVSGSGQEEVNPSKTVRHEKDTKGSGRAAKYTIQAFWEAAELVTEAANAGNRPTWGIFLTSPCSAQEKH
jgi:hypothetical protein